VAEWIDVDQKSTGEVTLVFEPRYNGTIKIASKIQEVKNGEVSFPISELRDGKYTPRLECDRGTINVSGFIKSGKSIAMAEDHGIAVRALIRECFELTKAKENLEKRVTQLEKLCKGHDIFNFERT
jgi:hypothetical protein